jgi:hypothetical protein
MNRRASKSGNPAKRAEATRSEDAATIERLRKELAETHDMVDTIKEMLWSDRVVIAYLLTQDAEKLTLLREAYRGAQRKELGDTLTIGEHGQLLVNGKRAVTRELYMQRARCVGLAAAMAETACAGEPEIAPWYEADESSLDDYLLELAAERMQSGGSHAAA